MGRSPSSKRGSEEGADPLLGTRKRPIYERYPALTGWLITSCIVIGIILTIAAYS